MWDMVFYGYTDGLGAMAPTRAGSERKAEMGCPDCAARLQTVESMYGAASKWFCF